MSTQTIALEVILDLAPFDLFHTARSDKIDDGNEIIPHGMWYNLIAVFWGLPSSSYAQVLNTPLTYELVIAARDER